MRDEHKLEIYREMRARDIDAGRESEIGQNTWRAVQGLPLLNPAGTSDGSILKTTLILAASAWLVYFGVRLIA